MRIKELRQCIEDGTVVAIHAGYRDKDEAYPSGAQPATVVAVKQKRRVYSGARHDFGGHITEDGVRIRYADAESDQNRYGRSTSKPITRTTGYGHHDEYEETEDRIVSARDVLCVWDEYLQRRIELESRERAAKSILDESKERAEVAATSLGGRAVPVYRSRDDFRVAGYKVELDLAAAEKLVGALGEGS